MSWLDWVIPPSQEIQNLRELEKRMEESYRAYQNGTESSLRWRREMEAKAK